ncbi:MAG: MucR family transcriptional regulator [Desulfobacteraceae bacterium]|nr:MucR family transcriptional regulator [Desulfobacteraceae bacterium]
MSKALVEIASEIVQAQVSLSSMSSTEIASSLRQVFSTLQELQKYEAGGLDLQQEQASQDAVSDDAAPSQLTRENSIHNDKIVCLECGAEMRQLTQKHLITHGLSPKEYKKKYGFSMRTPLAAKSLTKARSKAAKKRGLPENLIKFLETKKQTKISQEASSQTSGQQNADGEPRKVVAETRLRKKLTTV